jgi:uncharacterized protein YjdB
MGETLQLTATIFPDNASNKNVSWSSSDEAVATVTDDGLVTAVSAGSAEITVTTADGGKTATCTVTVNTPAVPVQSVSLDIKQMNLYTGETQLLTATVYPNNASNRNVSWSSSNNAVATVTDGLVTAVSAGSAEITVTTADGNKTATCNITVNTPVVQIQSVSLDITQMNLYTGETQLLTATVYPNNASNKNVSWSSSNNTVATVTDGLVTAVSAGSAEITVTTADGGKTATCTVRVYNIPAVRVQSVSLDVTEKELSIGERLQLTATVRPNSASNKKVRWSSGNSAIATITDGLVTAVSAGNTVITVTTDDGGKTATCEIRVVTGTGTDAIEDFKLSSYFKGNILYVESPKSERIDVYSLTGQLLVQHEKQAGLVKIAISGSSNQFLIVKGNSGWVMKVIKQQ